MSRLPLISVFVAIAVRLDGTCYHLRLAAAEASVGKRLEREVRALKGSAMGIERDGR
jgi:hypothetical protein